MKLYYSKGACSLSPRIILNELGLPFMAEAVDIRKKLTEGGINFLTINPKGQVPTLMLDSGEVLTEGVAIVQYLADLAPEKGLMPKGPGLAKYRAQEWLNFISTEVHKNFSPLFGENSDEIKNAARERLQLKFQILGTALTKNKFLMGESFTVADAYLFTVLNWSGHVKVNLPAFLLDYTKRVAERPSVQKALKDEGLI